MLRLRRTTRPFLLCAKFKIVLQNGLRPVSCACALFTLDSMQFVWRVCVSLIIRWVHCADEILYSQFHIRLLADDFQWISELVTSRNAHNFHFTGNNWILSVEALRKYNAFFNKRKEYFLVNYLIALKRKTVCVPEVARYISIQMKWQQHHHFNFCFDSSEQVIWSCLCVNVLDEQQNEMFNKYFQLKYKISISNPTEWISIWRTKSKKKTDIYEYLSDGMFELASVFPLLHIQRLLVASLVCTINICLDLKCSWHLCQSEFMKVASWKRQQYPSVRDVFCYLLPFACIWWRCFKLYSFQYHTLNEPLFLFVSSVHIITK